MTQFSPELPFETVDLVVVVAASMFNVLMAAVFLTVATYFLSLGATRYAHARGVG